jgi:hypothetical protein
MTQALNLALFANNLNTSGASSNAGLQNSAINIATTSPITGGANTALGGTVTIAHATSGVTAASYTNANITVNAQGHVTAASSGAAGVTSVATGNGLQGGTITTSGTLSVACPTFNTVGSYASVYVYSSGGSTISVNGGSNYSAGTGDGQFQAGGVGDAMGGGFSAYASNTLSGTWKWMGVNQQISQAGLFSGYMFGTACRVS